MHLCTDTAFAVCCRRTSRPSGTEISTSVIITGFADFEGDVGNGQSACEAAAHNSRGFNAAKINYVITLNAIGEENTLHRYEGLGNERGSTRQMTKRAVAGHSAAGQQGGAHVITSTGS